MSLFIHSPHTYQLSFIVVCRRYLEEWWCRSRFVSGTSGRLQDTGERGAKRYGLSGPEQRQVPLSKVYEHIQPEEQFVLALEIRVRPATEIRLPVLRLRVEEILEYTRACATEALWLQRERGQRVAR